MKQNNWPAGLARTLFVLFAGIPILSGVLYALLYSLGLTGVLADGFTLEHWREVLGNPAFWHTLAYSLYIAMISIAVSLGLALWLVLRFPNRFQRGNLAFFIYWPLSIPAIVMAFFVFQLMGKGGWLSRLAYQTGLIRSLDQFPDWVNDPWGIGIMTAHIFMATPFLTIYLGNIYTHERVADYLNLANTLGATDRQAMLRVGVPILLRRSLATLFLYVMFVMGSYEIPLLLGSQSSQMVSVRTIQRLQRFNLGDIPEAYVISVAYTVLIGILLAVFLTIHRRQLNRL